MGKELWDVILFFLVAGILCPLGAILFKLGKMKPVFLPLPINPEVPVHWYYGLWPIGIGSLLTCVGLMIDNKVVAMIGFFGIVPFALIFMIWKLHWLKPDWLLWLEDRYDHPTISFMFDQARQEKGWGQKVDTQAGLEAWAKEMEQKYRSYMGNGYG